jgi:hypothetical protein
MKTFSKIILAFLSTSLFFSCENPNPKFNQLPPITTEGKGTFGYKVDGEVQGQCYDGLFTNLAKVEIVGDSIINLYNSCNYFSFGIYIVRNIDSLSKDVNISTRDAYMYYHSPSSLEYISNSNDNSFAALNILMLDEQQKIFAATFAGQLFNENGESVEITDGRFDLIYKEY